MNYIIFSKLLKYVDCFGTSFNFYTERNRKLYTPLGGILTLFSLICGTLIFISMNIEELKHNIPISSTSVIQEKYSNIKFAKEKIWIPWRVRDYEGHLANITGLLYPIIYYYSGVRNKSENKLNLGYSFLNYKLCSETSMINNTDYFIIDVPLHELYCIDMENLDMGGNWDYDFVNYVEFDLYVCKNGIDYNETNKNCTSYDDLILAAQKDNSFEFEIYYPMVHYQPMNKSSPIFVKYNSYFYHLSRFSNKIDRLYLQKHVLIDDKGWVSKKEKITKFWGCEKLSGDSYATGETKDLMNEGSSSRLYSFNIYLNFETMVYNRYHKKIFLIIADGLPIVYIVFNFFKFIAKVIKIASGNKKLTELLFENLQEKTSKIKKNKINEFNFTNKKSFIDKKNNNQIKRVSKNNINEINNNSNNEDKLNNNNNNNNNVSEFSSINLNNHEQIKNMLKNHKEKINSTESHSNNNNNKINFSNKKLIYNNIFNINSNIPNPNGNSQTNSNSLNFNMIELFNDKSKDLLSQSANSAFKKDNISELNKSSNNNKLLLSQKSKRYFVQKKLFPYKYYLCSIFIKNFDSKKKIMLFYSKIYRCL